MAADLDKFGLWLCCSALQIALTLVAKLTAFAISLKRACAVRPPCLKSIHALAAQLICRQLHQRCRAR